MRGAVLRAILHQMAVHVFPRLSALVPSLVVVTVACGPFIGDDDFDPERYRGMVEEAQEDGLTVYWLGREFEAGGLILDEIDPSLSKDADGNVSSVELNYVPNDRHEGGAVGGTLTIESLSPRPIGEVTGRIGEPAAQYAKVEKRAVSVNNTPAELVTIWLLSLDDPTTRYLAFELPAATVVMTTSAFRARGQLNINPLMDEDLFLSVAERLKPYSE